MVTTPKAKRCIFISRNQKCLGYSSILNKSRRYPLFSALLRSQFGPIWISSLGCLKQQCGPSGGQLVCSTGSQYKSGNQRGSLAEAAIKRQVEELVTRKYGSRWRGSPACSPSPSTDALLTSRAHPHLVLHKGPSSSSTSFARLQFCPHARKKI